MSGHITATVRVSAPEVDDYRVGTRYRSIVRTVAYDGDKYAITLELDPEPSMVLSYGAAYTPWSAAYTIGPTPSLLDRLLQRLGLR